MYPDPFHVSAEGETLQALGYEITLSRRRVGDVLLPSGRLVACDPLLAPETEPFARQLPVGGHPVYVVIAELREEIRIAYALIEFGEAPATRWEVATVEGEGPAAWGEITSRGFFVESGVAAFLDGAAGTYLLDLESYAEDEDELERRVNRSLRRQRKNGMPVGFSAMNLDPRGQTNLVLFDTDRGTYPTYFGLDQNDEVMLAVTDFGVLDYQFTPYGLRY